MESQKLVSFREFILQESSEQEEVDSQLRQVKDDIKLTKSKIYLKQLIRHNKILKDKERTTSTATGFKM